MSETLHTYHRTTIPGRGIHALKGRMKIRVKSGHKGFRWRKIVVNQRFAPEVFRARQIGRVLVFENPSRCP